MNKKIKTLIAVGGTGGHVFPGFNLALHLLKNNDHDVELVTDKRGSQYLGEITNLNISLLPSSPIKKRNIFTILISSVLVFYSLLRSLTFLILNRPSIIFGMGGYASFPICFAAIILKIDFIIYENNLIIGKSNKYLLPFAKKILVANKSLQGIPKKYEHKIFESGNILKKEIISLTETNPKKIDLRQIRILILGGSQAAKIFAEILPNIFRDCSNMGIPLKIYQHCLPSQNEKLKLFYEKAKIDFEIFNFSNDLTEYFLKVNLAITRSGSSMLAELTNVNIPFISIPLPSAADNHQLINADFYQNKNLSFLIEEKDLNKKLLQLIREIYQDQSILDNIVKNQRQYSDKNVYNNIDQALKEIINEKN